MKNYLTLVVLLIFSVAIAQNDKKLDRIKALRVAYISNKLELTKQEAEKFWPVFNTFDDKQLDLRIQKRILTFKLQKQNSTINSEKEMSAILDESEKIEDEMQSNRKTFVKNLKGIISPQKIILLKRLEIEFKQELINKIKDKKAMRR